MFIFGNMFSESHGFVAVPVTRSNNFVVHHLLDLDKFEHVSLLQLVTVIGQEQVMNPLWTVPG